MADLKSFHSCGVYGMAAIANIVAQNTRRPTYSQSRNKLGERTIRKRI